MPRIRRTQADGRVRLMLTLTVEESDLVDEVREDFPASTWCRAAVLREARRVRAAVTAKPAEER